MLKFKFSIILVILFCSCMVGPKYSDRETLVLSKDLDTICLIKYPGNIEIEVKPTLRKSISSLGDSIKQFIVIIGDEKPIIKALGSK